MKTQEKAGMINRRKIKMFFIGIGYNLLRSGLSIVNRSIQGGY
jgi:hypothetical protein